jgi:maleamate amidohydrolase
MDDAIFKYQNFGNRIGFGRRVGLLIVDFVNGFNDPDLFGGGNIDPAIRATVPLLDAFRRHGLPVVHTRVVFADDGSNTGLMCLKAPALAQLTETAQAGQIVPALVPRAGEHVVRKTHASAFFGTDLTGWLIRAWVDTLAIAGCTTSGCVRASVVDACGYNIRPMVAADCVGDRSPDAHRASLFDMTQKYADVMESTAIVAALGRAAA